MGIDLSLSRPLERELQETGKLACESPDSYEWMSDLVSQLTAQGLAQSSLPYMKIEYLHTPLILKTFGINSKQLPRTKPLSEATSALNDDTGFSFATRNPRGRNALWNILILLKRKAPLMLESLTSLLCLQCFSFLQSVAGFRPELVPRNIVP